MESERNAIVIIFAFVIITYIIGLLIRSLVSQTPSGKKQSDQPTTTVQTYGYYTAAEVARHKTKGDLWLIIQPKGSDKRKVYNVTDYVDEHPGEDSIFNNAGGDATEGFLGPQHPDNAAIILEQYCIGELAAA